MEKICAHNDCNNSFTTNLSAKKYCSKKCHSLKSHQIKRIRICENEECKKEFITWRVNKTCCRKNCRAQKNNQIRREINGRTGLSPIMSGAVCELKVCSDLLEKGYEVYRTVSHVSSCDLIILKNGIISRVEVRKGQITSTGLISCPFCDKSKCDILAIVIKDKIKYEPELLGTQGAL